MSHLLALSCVLSHVYHVYHTCQRFFSPFTQWYLLMHWQLPSSNLLASFRQRDNWLIRSSYLQEPGGTNFLAVPQTVKSLSQAYKWRQCRSRQVFVTPSEQRPAHGGDPWLKNATSSPLALYCPLVNFNWCKFLVLLQARWSLSWRLP